MLHGPIRWKKLFEIQRAQKWTTNNWLSDQMGIIIINFPYLSPQTAARQNSKMNWLNYNNISITHNEKRRWFSMQAEAEWTAFVTKGNKNNVIIGAVEVDNITWGVKGDSLRTWDLVRFVYGARHSVIRSPILFLRYCFRISRRVCGWAFAIVHCPAYVCSGHLPPLFRRSLFVDDRLPIDWTESFPHGVAKLP